MTSPSGEMFDKAEKMREQFACKNDRLLEDMTAAVFFMLLSMSSGMMVLLSWYFEKEIGGAKADWKDQVAYFIPWFFFAVMMGMLVASLFGWIYLRNLRKKAKIMQDLAERLEKSELEMQLKKAAQKHAAEAGAKAQAASDASLISQKIETTEQMQASRVAKAVQETRDERRQEKTDGRKGSRGITP